MIKRLFIMATIIFIVIWLAGLVKFHEKIYNEEYDRKSKADAIVVLTGGKNRLHVATKLLNENMADKLFISGVSKEISLQEIANREDIEIYNEENIEIGQEALNTIGNAKEIDQWVKTNNIKKIRLVTSNYHVPRSIKELKNVNPELEVIIHPVYSDNIPKKWWKNWNSICFIIKEYNKFLYVSVSRKIENKIKGN